MGDEQKFLFRESQQEVNDAVKISHRDLDKELWVYNDASDELWAAVVTQCEQEMLDSETEDQIHQPLVFPEGRFMGSQVNWTTFEKEALAIYEVFQKWKTR